MPRFRTETGRLTDYSFACGYIEQKSTDPAPERFRKLDLYTELWHEGACYHVRQTDYRGDGIPKRVFWESFETLHEARDLFGRQKGRIINMVRGVPVIGAGRSIAKMLNT